MKIKWSEYPRGIDTSICRSKTQWKNCRKKNTFNRDTKHRSHNMMSIIVDVLSYSTLYAQCGHQPPYILLLSPLPNYSVGLPPHTGYPVRGRPQPYNMGLFPVPGLQRGLSSWPNAAIQHGPLTHHCRPPPYSVGLFPVPGLQRGHSSWPTASKQHGPLTRHGQPPPYSVGLSPVPGLPRGPRDLHRGRPPRRRHTALASVQYPGYHVVFHCGRPSPSSVGLFPVPGLLRGLSSWSTAAIQRVPLSSSGWDYSIILYRGRTPPYSMGLLPVPCPGYRRHTGWASYQNPGYRVVLPRDRPPPYSVGLSTVPWLPRGPPSWPTLTRTRATATSPPSWPTAAIQPKTIPVL